MLLDPALAEKGWAVCLLVDAGDWGPGESVRNFARIVVSVRFRIATVFTVKDLEKPSLVDLKQR